MLHWIKCIYAASILALWIFGIIVLVLATMIRDNLSVFALVTEDTGIGDFYLKTFFPVIFPILITVACFIFVIGCIGYCGVFTKSQTLLGWFFFSLLVTFCVELSAGVWRIIEYDLSYNDTDFNQLKKNIKLYTDLQITPNWFKDSWTQIHRKFDCCGVDSYMDWISNDHEILKTCCPIDVSDGACPIIILGTRGCGNDLLSYLNSSKYMAVLPYITGIMGVIQVLAMLLTLKIWLDSCLKSKHKSETTYVPTSGPGKMDEKQFYEIEMESKIGRACYISPSMTYKDTRVYTYPTGTAQSVRGTTPQLAFSHVIPPVADKETSDDVIEKEERPISARSCIKTDSSRNGENNHEQRQKKSEINSSSLTRRDAASDVVRQTRLSEACTCSLGRQKINQSSQKLRLNTNGSRNEDQQSLKKQKSKIISPNKTTHNQTELNSRTSNPNAPEVTPLLNERLKSEKQEHVKTHYYLFTKESNVSSSFHGQNAGQLYVSQTTPETST